VTAVARKENPCILLNWRESKKNTEIYFKIQMLLGKIGFFGCQLRNSFTGLHNYIKLLCQFLAAKV
jgi:hypothetical protein